jgi:hypothetical protein
MELMELGGGIVGVMAVGKHKGHYSQWKSGSRNSFAFQLLEVDPTPPEFPVNRTGLVRAND